MGSHDSKEDADQIVAIYGYESNDFDWRQIDNRTCYHTTGLIISDGIKKYVITVRTRLISCKKIIMYHGCLGDGNIIMRNDLHILFQCPEFDLIILGTVDKNELDFSKSQNINNGMFIDPVVHGHLLTSQIIIPNKRMKYYVIRIDNDIVSATINYHIHVAQVKFKKSMVYTETYLPSNHIYEFEYQDESSMPGICGSIIYDKTHDLIGMVFNKINKRLLVLPTKVLYKIIMDFYQFHQNPTHYSGLLCFPFILTITEKTTVVLNHQIKMKTSAGKKKILRKNDELLTINNQKIIINRGIIMVFDNEYKENIPIDVYLRLLLRNNISINLLVRRNGKVLEFSYVGKPLNKYIFPITTLPYFHPTCSIPHTNINGIIVVQFTHDLLNFMALHKITLVNDVINRIVDDGCNECEKHLLVVDCLNHKLVKKYQFPSISYKKQVLEVPVLIKINSINVWTLTDIIKITKSKNIKTVSIGNSNEYITTIQID